MDLTSGCICDFECTIVDKLVNGAFGVSKKYYDGKTMASPLRSRFYRFSLFRFILYSEDVGACLDPEPWQDVQIQAWTVCMN